MNILGLFRSPPSSPNLSSSPGSSPLPPPSSTFPKAIVDSSTTPESKPSRWWHDTRLNARVHLGKPRRIGSDPSSSVRVETGTAGNMSRHHTPNNSVTSIPSEMTGEGMTELSTKLVEAVEKQADLEDTLAQLRHELEVANQKTKQLEQAQKDYADMMDKGMLIEKKDVENETTELTRRLLEESKNRVQAENDKNKIEQEVEMLTAKLFEEANNLVASARRENKALEKRNDQLQNRLEDTETLLQSQQDQLAELKAVMQRMQESDTQSSPVTPNLGGKPSRESLSRVVELSPLHINSPFPESEATIESAKSTEISPFSFYVRPQYRYDTPAYSDFKSFVRISRASISNQPRQLSGSFPSMAPTPSSAFYITSISGKESPPLPTSSSRSPSLTSPTLAERLPLKEWRFVKRSLTEDIDPTLRLDIAPGLSWIARRGVQSSILDGTLIIEPTPPNSIMVTYACTLCGEKRDGPRYIRSHRFCTSENASSQRYPLCQYCLERMRVTCDFVGFLRAVRDGIWKIDGEEGEEKAWDESVRLRERMFWARFGTQSFIPANGKPAEERVSTETGESGIETTKMGDPVTPELQITKTFEEMKVHNDEIAQAYELKVHSEEIPRSEPQSPGHSGTQTPEFVDAQEPEEKRESEEIQEPEKHVVEEENKKETEN